MVIYNLFYFLTGVFIFGPFLVSQPLCLRGCNALFKRQLQGSQKYFVLAATAISGLILVGYLILQSLNYIPNNIKITKPSNLLIIVWLITILSKIMLCGKEKKVEKINNRISPIQDEYIEKYFAEKELDLVATLDGAAAYRDAEFVIIAAPTNYDPQKNFFDTHHIEDVIDLVLEVNPSATMIIKSTIPVGYCRSLYVKYAQVFKEKGWDASRKLRLLFSPEFLRESKALYDNLYPSRNL